MDIKKVVGTKVKAIYPEVVHAKLYAYGEVIAPLLSEMGSTGSYNKKRLDTITFGLDEIYRDILTELDQIFFRGAMERSSEEPEDQTKEFSDSEEPAEREINKSKEVEKPAPEPSLHVIVERELELPDLWKGQDRLSYWMAEIDTEIYRLQELKRRCMEERARRKEKNDTDTNER